MTIKDIAKNLNVSYSTVSLSLNNDPRVAEKTKKRVIEEAERLGFTFNANARSLVTKKQTVSALYFQITLMRLITAGFSMRLRPTLPEQLKTADMIFDTAQQKHTFPE